MSRAPACDRFVHSRLANCTEIQRAPAVTPAAQGTQSGWRVWLHHLLGMVTGTADCSGKGSMSCSGQQLHAGKDRGLRAGIQLSPVSMLTCASISASRNGKGWEFQRMPVDSEMARPDVISACLACRTPRCRFGSAGSRPFMKRRCACWRQSSS